MIVGLQPWEDSPHPTAIGIANVQLQSDKTLKAVQYAQARMFINECEKFNSVFQAPMVICGSFNVEPDPTASSTSKTRGKLLMGSSPSN
mgnify:CR=1 FL=1